MKPVLFVFMLILLTQAIVGCTPTSAPSSTGAVQPSSATTSVVPTNALATASSSVQLTQVDSNKQVTVPQGGTLEIVLDQNASTGYSWQLLSTNDSVLRLLSNKTTGVSALPGASSKQVYKFQSVSSGLSATRLGYKMWTNAQAEPEITFEVMVIVPGTPVLPTVRPTQVGAPKPLETLTKLALQDSGKTIAFPANRTFQVDFDLDAKNQGAWQIIGNNSMGLQLISIGIVYPGGTSAVTVPRQTFTFKALPAATTPLRLGFKDWGNEAAQPNPVFEVTPSVSLPSNLSPAPIVLPTTGGR